MDSIKSLKEEIERLKCCFNCKLKFSCPDSQTGKYDPCEDWTNQYPKKVLS